MLLGRLAFRNILRQRRRSLLTSLMMVGGFVLSSISLGISDGTYSHLIDQFTKSNTGHVQIHRQNYLDRPTLHGTFAAEGDLDRLLSSQPGIRSWTPRVYSAALVFKKAKTTGLQLVGIDPQREGETTRLPRKVSTGRFLDPAGHNEIVLSANLARILGAAPGDGLILISQGADGSIANDRFRLVGTIEGQSGAMNGYTLLGSAQDFLTLGNRIHEVVITLADQGAARSTAAALQGAVDAEHLEVLPWQEVERAFFKAMQADVQGMWLSLGIIMVVVAIGVLNTVLMTILERTREFGVMRALGTRPGTVFALVVLETLMLALLSIAPAALISFGLNWWLHTDGIALSTPISMEGDDIVFDTVLGSVAPHVFWLPAAVILGSALLVSFFPALRAARIRPIDALRSH